MLVLKILTTIFLGISCAVTIARAIKANHDDIWDSGVGLVELLIAIFGLSWRTLAVVSTWVGLLPLTIISTVFLGISAVWFMFFRISKAFTDDEYQGSNLVWLVLEEAWRALAIVTLWIIVV